MNGARLLEHDTCLKPARVRRSSSRFSWTGLRYEWSSATAATSMPSPASASIRSSSEAASSGSSTEPSAAILSGTSTTVAYSGSGLQTSRAKRSGRCWSPIRSRSAKPRVMNSAIRAPRRSSSALVPRVVPRRIDSTGSDRGGGVPVRRRAASTGASSGDRTSNAAPGGTSPGSSPDSSTTDASGSWRTTSRRGCRRSSSRKRKP